MSRAIRSLVVVGLTLAASSETRAQRLFKWAEPVELTITTDLKRLIKQRDSLEIVKHGAMASYVDSAGKTVAFPVTLRARGHFRRQARNCDFPPLYFEPKNSASKGTLFANAGKLKLATNCRPGNDDYQQYILQELVLYRAYATLTDTSFRTRLAHVTYRDSVNAVRPITSWAFFIEDPELMAVRVGGVQLKKTGAYFDDLERDPLGRVGMFEYFIGNTDWSIAALHNIVLVSDTLAHIAPVPYDFDWSGAVNARYAFPDARFKTHSVRKRIYRGDCRDEKALRPVVERFVAKRSAIDALFAGLPQLDASRAKEMRAYFDEFWSTVSRPASIARAVADGCQAAGN
ncbi:MAG: hypothetical protein HYR75_05875 [Gemmatimonadetes bacterium]|nr:hypothetical protein [Gemmatimonadota bacterium]MBI3504615.1 hypothetical protein [Pseudomonadota bacterium]